MARPPSRVSLARRPRSRPTRTKMFHNVDHVRHFAGRRFDSLGGNAFFITHRRAVEVWTVNRRAENCGAIASFVEDKRGAFREACWYAGAIAA